MRRSPSIVPAAADRDAYLVLDDFGELGRSWRETDEAHTNRDSVITDLLQGQYSWPVQVVAFNTAEGWSRDVSEEVAAELLQRLASEVDAVPVALQDFIDRHRTPAAEQLPLPLPLRRIA